MHLPSKPCCRTSREEILRAIETVDSLVKWNRPRFIEGIGDVDRVLSDLGVLSKQNEDLSTPEGFLEWVIRVALDLSLVDQTLFEKEFDTIRGFMAANWPAMSEAQVNSAIAELVTFVGGLRDEILGDQIPLLSTAVSEVVGDSKAAHAARFGLSVIPAFNLRDEEAEKFLVDSTVNFMRDRDGRISESLTLRAKRVVERGLAQGLGRGRIATNLETELGKIRSLAYYDLIAGQFVNRARSYGALRTYQESGIELAEILATLDERTTDVCRFLDGKFIKVNDALDMLSGLEGLTNPKQVKFANPWIHRVSGNGGAFLEVRKGEEKNIRIARIIRSGVGTVDDVGEFANSMSMSDLQVLGIGPPPYHAFCRTTIIPVMDA